MNKLLKALPIAAAMFIGTQATAAIDKPDMIEYCQGIKAVAAATMELRQGGTSYAEADQSARVVQAMNIWPDLVVPMMADAYDVPAYRTEMYQAQAIAEFSDRYYLACIVTLIDME